MSPDTPARHVLVAGVSTRAIAESAARAGYQVTAIDAFGDRDQHADVRALSLPRDFRVAFGPRAVVDAARALPHEAVAYLSPFENHPALVTALAEGRSLWGNPAAVLREVRAPFNLAAALGRRGIDMPAAHRQAPAGDGDFLIKPFASGGGHAIRVWRHGMTVGRGSYVQERIEGVPGSVVFAAAGGRAVPFAITRQLAGDPAFGARPFRYCGSVLMPPGDPFGFPQTVSARIEQIAAAVAHAFGLVGVNGVDFIERGGAVFPIEVNPRWCASMELVERERPGVVFAAHARACASGTLEGIGADAPAARTYGKAIVFARETVVTGDTSGWLEDPDIRDVPHPDERIPSGAPICTVFATAGDGAACYAALARRAQRVYEALADGLPCGRMPE